MTIIEKLKEEAYLYDARYLGSLIATIIDYESDEKYYLAEIDALFAQSDETSSYFLGYVLTKDESIETKGFENIKEIRKFLGNDENIPIFIKEVRAIALNSSLDKTVSLSSAIKDACDESKKVLWNKNTSSYQLLINKFPFLAKYFTMFECHRLQSIPEDLPRTIIDLFTKSENYIDKELLFWTYSSAIDRKTYDFYKSKIAESQYELGDIYFRQKVEGKLLTI